MSISLLCWNYVHLPDRHQWQVCRKTYIWLHHTKVQSSNFTNKIQFSVLKTTQIYVELLKLLHLWTNLKERIGSCITGQELQGMARCRKHGTQLLHRCWRPSPTHFWGKISTRPSLPPPLTQGPMKRPLLSVLHMVFQLPIHLTLEHCHIRIMSVNLWV